MKKNNLFLSILFLFCLAGLAAQVSVNPTDEFYEDAVGWFLKGYVDYLPQLKPYSTKTIESILKTVMECDEENEKAIATEYYNRYFGRKIHVSAGGDFSSRFQYYEDDEKKYAHKVDENGKKADKEAPKYMDNFELYSAWVSVGGDVKINSCLGFGYDFGLRGINNNEKISDLLQTYENSIRFQGIEDLTFSKGDIDFLLDLDGVVTFGKKNFNGSVGFNRVGYGFYPDSDLILNPSSHQIANATFNYVSDFFEYTHLSGVPVAQSQTSSNDFDWAKMMSFHSLRVPLFKKKLNDAFTFSYYESVVYGGTYNASYLLPVPWVVIANVAGFNENVIAGINVSVKPLRCLTWNTDFIIDDIEEIKDFVKLKWNNAGVRTAFKTGLVYNPIGSICRLVQFDYTLITPYTYSFYDTSSRSYNYSDYTNYGKSMGSELIPNSHQINVTVKFKPIKRLTITSNSKFILHANEYENLEDEEVISLGGKCSTNGDLKQTTKNLKTPEGETGFMNQDHKMAILRTGIDFDYEFRNSASASAKISIGYGFEYIMNKGVDSEIFPGAYTSVAQVKAARAEWESNLYNSFNQYFKAGVELKF